MTEAARSGGAPAPARQSFAALRHPGYRIYFFGSALAMMADSIEHVITYWMMWQKFHSPALGGFAIISHWVPFLLFSVYSGALADRYDPRRIIQLGMLFFMLSSFGWGMFLLTDSLQMWHAAALLVVHGFAGVLWFPAGQLLIHDIVEPAQLPSAVRLNATSRYLGLLMGPAVGGVILLALGPSYGILFNVLIYLPLTLWLWKAPYGPRFRKDKAAPTRAIRGLADIVMTARSVAANPSLLLMTLLAGSASLVIGNAYQAQMPGFAQALGHGQAGIAYTMLLAADAAGAFTAGIMLEGSGWLQPRNLTALVLAMLWVVAIGGFAVAPSYPAALAFLFTAGFFELSFNAMAQTLVQLNAPGEIRGRVIGLFNMFGVGLRAFSGVTVGLGGSLVGIHWSLGLSAILLFFVIGSLLLYATRSAAVAR